MEIIKHKDKYYLKSNNGYREVLASTDKSLCLREQNDFLSCCRNKEECHCKLPQPSEQFINQYVKAYNNGKPIEEVEVEYEEHYDDMPEDEEDMDLPWRAYAGYRLKVNSDNTINIKLVKDTWTREEVIKLIESIPLDDTLGNEYKLYKWIEENF